jgi:soluble lytic murein transglycosylase-like protein
MPATARRFGLKDPFDVQASIEAQAKYMRFLLNKFGDYALALAGYNAGEGNVQKYGNRIPPFKETQNYVKSILGRIEKLAGYNPSKKKN